jgi:hypothetical protein
VYGIAREREHDAQIGKRERHEEVVLTGKCDRLLLKRNRTIPVAAVPSVHDCLLIQDHHDEVHVPRVPCLVQAKSESGEGEFTFSGNPPQHAHEVAELEGRG